MLESLQADSDREPAHAMALAAGHDLAAGEAMTLHDAKVRRVVGMTRQFLLVHALRYPVIPGHG